MARGALVGACVFCAPMLCAGDAFAGRPFITDDASVVGRGVLQLEAWLRLEEGMIQQWTVAAVGPLGPLEISAGIAAALASTDGWEPRVAGAIGQLKALVLEPRPAGIPGIAGVIAVFPPAGSGSFATESWHAASYAALTALPFANERWAIHANLGVALATNESLQAGPYWALGTSVEIVEGLDVMGEVFSAEPAEDARIGATQVGLIVAFNEHVQLDGTFGGVVWGDDQPEVFATAGVKLASGELW
ncbi:MAG TPA: transporter [Polyangiaceae bacterium]|nr:transporter [Polyangiaceae bacterium]